MLLTIFSQNCSIDNVMLLQRFYFKFNLEVIQYNIEVNFILFEYCDIKKLGCEIKKMYI